MRNDGSWGMSWQLQNPRNENVQEGQRVQSSHGVPIVSGNPHTNFGLAHNAISETNAAPNNQYQSQTQREHEEELGKWTAKAQNAFTKRVSDCHGRHEMAKKLFCRMPATATANGYLKQNEVVVKHEKVRAKYYFNQDYAKTKDVYRKQYFKAYYALLFGIDDTDFNGGRDSDDDDSS